MPRITSLTVAIRVAVGSGLPALIEDGERTLDSLARATDMPPDRLVRLLRYLDARELLRQDHSGDYHLTQFGRQVLKPGRPAYLINPQHALGRAELSFMYLDDALRTGNPGYERLYGTPFWEHMDQVPELGASLDECMEEDSHGIARAIKGCYDWSTVDHLVDVGGGRGVVLRELLIDQPSMRGTVLDLPRAAAEAESAIKRDGLESCCNVVAASCFDPIPVTGAKYLLSNILHDWDDSQSVEILKRCAEAAGSDGRVLIVEEVPELGADMRRFTHSDLQMLLFFGGRERSLDEYETLLTKAGLKFESGIPTRTSYGILVASVA